MENKFIIGGIYQLGRNQEQTQYYVVVRNVNNNIMLCNISYCLTNKTNSNYEIVCQVNRAIDEGLISEEAFFEMDIDTVLEENLIQGYLGEIGHEIMTCLQAILLMSF